MKGRVLLWGAVLAGVFLLGFLPPYMKAGRLQSESREAAARLNGLEIRDLAALAAVQSAQKNYGQAGQTASQFYNRVRDAASREQDEGLRRRLEELMKNRDAVIAALARGDASAVEMLQSAYLNARAATAQ